MKLKVLLFIATAAQFTGAAEYQPGTPGGAWTPTEIDIVRQKVLMMIDPHQTRRLYPWTNLGGVYPTENRLLRLAFHDCVKYTDGTGGCDGCLNWAHMGFRFKNFFKLRFPVEERKPKRYYPVVRKGDNNDLGHLAEALEKIYTTTYWPEGTQKLDASLKSTGKSRADLWAFAANVALEQSIERANYACDHDRTMRQQIGLLEGRDKCDIKLTRPIKFFFGRTDCIPDPNAPYPYVASKEEVQPSPFGSGDEALIFMKENFGMTIRHSAALMAIHSVANTVPLNIIGIKYSWLGNGYLSSLYFKLIANRPMYVQYIQTNGRFGRERVNNDVAVGGENGEPLALTQWRVHCGPVWNTTDGGPCFVRPSKQHCPEKNPERPKLRANCFGGYDDAGKRIPLDTDCCRDATFTDDGVQIGGCEETKRRCGFNLQFALPYELGMYNKMSYKNDTLRPWGCDGINIERKDPRWNGRPTYGTPVMTCQRNDLNLDGEPAYKVIEDFADNHDVWARDFLDGWELMQANGYGNSLSAGPQNGWLGFNSLRERGDVVDDYESFIHDNVPLVFTNPNANPLLCDICYIRFRD